MRKRDRMVLGIVHARGEAYGLDVWDDLPWHMRFGTYTALHGLLRRGFLRVHVNPENGRSVYQTTPSGRMILGFQE